jgi:hypothetical protein
MISTTLTLVSGMICRNLSRHHGTYWEASFAQVLRACKPVMDLAVSQGRDLGAMRLADRIRREPWPAMVQPGAQDAGSPEPADARQPRRRVRCQSGYMEQEYQAELAAGVGQRGPEPLQEQVLLRHPTGFGSHVSM